MSIFLKKIAGLANIPIENMIFVSKNGNDSVADGTVVNPFLTIKNAINYINYNMTPSSGSPVVVHIFPGDYEEDRGTYVEDIWESSIIVPDWVFLVGEDKNSVIIRPDNNVSGEGMGLFGAVQESSASAALESHIGFSNLTISGTLYGDAIQLDSFIKSPDFPEFRLWLDNLIIKDCEQGIKGEERNSWIYGNDLYFEDCNTSIQVDDTKFFGSNIIVRQKNSSAPLDKGIYAQDKRGKIQIFGLEIGPDYTGSDVAFVHGIESEDKAEIHIYNCRVDNARRSLYVSEEGEFKGWNVKFHDSELYDILTDIEDNSIEIYGGELGGVTRIDGGDLIFKNLAIDTDNYISHSIYWNSGGKIEISSCDIKTYGASGSTDFYCLYVETEPELFRLSSNSFRYDTDNAIPSYLIYSVPVIDILNICVSNNSMAAGMNGNIKTRCPVKYAGGLIDRYSTINDAINAAYEGDVIEIRPDTYTEQISPKPGITLIGLNRESTILQNTGSDASNYPLQIIDTISGTDRRAYNIKDITIKTLTTGSTIFSFGNNDTAAIEFEFDNCRFEQGNFIESVSNWYSNATFSNCYFGGGEEGFNLTGSILGRDLYLKFVDCFFSCSPDFSSTHETGSSQLKFLDGCSFFTSSGVDVGGDWSFICRRSEPNSHYRMQLSSSQNIQFESNTINGGMHFLQNPYSASFLSNLFVETPPGEYDITTDTYVTGVLYTNNTQDTGLSGGIITIGSTRYVGNSIDKYFNIEQAMSASFGGKTIEVHAGTYTERIFLKDGVDIKGANKDSTILQYDEDVFLFESDYTSSTISDITIKVTTTNNRIIDFDKNFPIFRNCKFESGYISSDSQSNDIDVEFRDCDINNSTNYIIDINDNVVDYNCALTLRGCNTFGKMDFDTVRGNVAIYNSILENAQINFTSSLNQCYFFLLRNTINGGTVPSGLINIYHSGSGTGNPRIIGNELGAVNGPILRFASDIGNVSEIINNSLLSVVSQPEIYVDSGVTVAGFTFKGNAMKVGIGGEGSFVLSGEPIRTVGGRGADFYQDIHSALRSVSTNNFLIKLYEGQSITASLDVPNYYNTLIDGVNEANITAGTGSILATMDDNKGLTFKNITLTGSLIMSGSNSSIKLLEGSKLYGSVEIQYGDQNSLIELYDSSIVANSASVYPILIEDSSSVVKIERSKMFGYGSGSAVYYRTENDFLKIRYSIAANGTITSPVFEKTSSIPYIGITSSFNLYNVTFDSTFSNASNNAYDLKDQDVTWY